MKNLKNVPIIILMGLIKYSPLVTMISGKLSGGKLYKGRSGNIISTKIKPINRRTTTQETSREYLRVFSKSWGTLTAASLQSWNNYGHQFSKKNRVGDTHLMTGFNAYILEQTRNCFCQQGAYLLTAPPSSATPTVNGNIANGVAVGGSTQTFVLDIPVVDSGDILVISATAPMSTGKTFIKGKYRPIIFQTAHVAQTAFSIIAAYTAVFGVVSTGKAIHLQGEYFSIAGSKLPKYLSGAPLEVIAT